MLYFYLAPTAGHTDFYVVGVQYQRTEFSVYVESPESNTVPDLYFMLEKYLWSEQMMQSPYLP